MKKRRIIFAVVLALSLVVGIGILSASAIVQIAGCHCYEACYYCSEVTGDCEIYDGPGACFCSNNPCHLNPHFLCCVSAPY